MAHQAIDTFVAELENGPVLIQKGQVYASNHPAVKLDAGRGVLFSPLDLGEAEEAPPPKRPRGRPRKTPVAAPPADDGDNGDEVE